MTERCVRNSSDLVRRQRFIHDMRLTTRLTVRVRRLFGFMSNYSAHLLLSYGRPIVQAIIFCTCGFVFLLLFSSFFITSYSITQCWRCERPRGPRVASKATRVQTCYFSRRSVTTNNKTYRRRLSTSTTGTCPFVCRSCLRHIRLSHVLFFSCWVASPCINYATYTATCGLPCMTERRREATNPTSKVAGVSV